MKLISLNIALTDDLGIESVAINWNDTNLPNDSRLLNKIAIALLISLRQNKESCELQDLLSELGIEKSDI